MISECCPSVVVIGTTVSSIARTRYQATRYVVLLVLRVLLVLLAAVVRLLLCVTNVCHLTFFRFFLLITFTSQSASLQSSSLSAPVRERRGHRRLSFSPLVQAFIFIGHRVQYSHSSSIFSEWCLLTLARFPRQKMAQKSAILFLSGIEPQNFCQQR